ncbi:MAG: response regulator [Adhaeribacter sp.]
MTVYLIDDDPFSLFLSKYLLGLELGVREIKAFDSAQQAFFQLKTLAPASYPDVVLLDLNMPLMDGWDFLEALNEFDSRLAERCNLYILTSSLESTDLSRSKNYPIVSGLIQKPLSREDVRLILSQLELNDGLGEQEGC